MWRHHTWQKQLISPKIVSRGNRNPHRRWLQSRLKFQFMNNSDDPMIGASNTQRVKFSDKWSTLVSPVQKNAQFHFIYATFKCFLGYENNCACNSRFCWTVQFAIQGKRLKSLIKPTRLRVLQGSWASAACPKRGGCATLWRAISARVYFIVVVCHEPLSQRKPKNFTALLFQKLNIIKLPHKIVSNLHA